MLGDQHSAPLARRSLGLLARLLWQRPALWWFVGALFCMLLQAVSLAAYAWLAGPTFKLLQGAVQASWLAVAIAGVALLRGLTQCGQVLCSTKLEHDLLHRLHLQITTHLQQLPWSTLSRLGSDNLGLRLTADVSRLHIFLAFGAAQLLQQGLIAIALLAFAVRLDARSTAWCLLVAPLAIIAIVATSRTTYRMQQAAWAQQHNLSLATLQAVQAIAVSQAYGCSDWLLRRVQQASSAFMRAAQQVSIRRSLSTPLLGLLAAAMAIAVLTSSASARAILAGRGATYASLLAAFAMLLRSTQRFGSISQSLVGGLAALERLDELLRLPAALQGPAQRTPQPLQQELVVENLSFAYDDRCIIENVSFVLRPGDRVALVGASGAGKTTLLLLLMGYLTPASGRIVIDGRERLHGDALRFDNPFAWVPQHPQLLVGSIAANILLDDMTSSGAENARFQAAVCGSGLTAAIERLTLGYDTLLDQQGAPLSMGERQRLCLARALYRQAPILLLDEPTASLDAESERHLERTLQTLARPQHSHDTPRTVLYSSHRLAMVAAAEHVLVLHEGRIAEAGSPHELWQQNSYYRRLFQLDDAHRL